MLCIYIYIILYTYMVQYMLSIFHKSPKLQLLIGTFPAFVAAIDLLTAAFWQLHMCLRTPPKWRRSGVFPVNTWKYYFIS